MNKTAAAAVISGAVILVNACTWGFAMITSSHTLSGTGAYQQIQHILSAGAAASFLVVSGGVVGLVGILKLGTKENSQ